MRYKEEIPQGKNLSRGFAWRIMPLMTMVQSDGVYRAGLSPSQALGLRLLITAAGLRGARASDLGVRAPTDDPMMRHAVSVGESLGLGLKGKIIILGAWNSAFTRQLFRAVGLGTGAHLMSENDNPLPKISHIDVLSAACTFYKALLSQSSLPDWARADVERLNDKTERIIDAHSRGKAAGGLPSVSISAEMWTPTGPSEDPRARLSSEIYVNGVTFTIEAFRVRLDVSLVQVLDSADDSLAKAYEAYSRAASQSFAPFGTLDIEGQPYIPFGAA